MCMAWIWTTIVVALVIATLLYRLVRFKKHKRLVWPPGPRGIPVLGHLHLLGKNPHRDLDKLAKKHGPVMYMRFGFVPVIIVSSSQAAEQFLKKYDLVFASRPRTEAAKYLLYGHRSFIFAPYGSYWQKIRKLSTSELLSNFKINSFQSMRREETDLLVESFKQAAKNGVIVDISAEVSTLSADMTCRMVFGKKYTYEVFGEKGFKASTQESMEVAAAPNLGDYLPFFDKLDIQGLYRRMKAISKTTDLFLENIIKEHEESRNVNGQKTQNKDFVDIMLDIMESGEAEFQIDRSHVKAILLDMLAASVDTSATVIEWTMTEFLKNPRVLKKVQNELQEVVGMNKKVAESDLDSLEYLNMVVKESLRLHPPVPLLLPHESIEDCTINGFHIPNKSRIFINAWAIGRDPNVWSDPEKFIPERFMDNNIDVRGRDFQLIPFGSGRRSCPGMQLGLIIVRLVIAQLVHCYDWKLPNDMQPTELDMTEHFGLVVSKAKHLMAFPSYRLQN